MDVIFNWAGAAESRYICFCTVHMIMESYASEEFRSKLNDADFVNPDGMPLVWTLRMLGASRAHRVTAPDITLMICERAARESIPVGFYGGSQKALDALVANVKSWYPNLNVAYVCSPPFRPLTAEEDEQITQEIEQSGTRILFMGLGCPKQERWMRSHRGKVHAVMLGVGATFDFHAGFVKRAPQWLQNLGLEWFYRVLMEPRRLWWRYLSTNPRYIALALLQIIGISKYPKSVRKQIP
jgi:N-acetylglucosaminyldiphosphoundecaprenol N-acetyl-beta-D-mannosaminyltransferase